MSTPTELNKESEEIYQRVEQSRLEVKKFRDEYEQLIKQGLQTQQTRPDILETAPPDNPNDENASTIPVTPKKLRKVSTPKLSPKPQQNVTASPKKQRSYDREAARAYIKKQREKRAADELKLKESRQVNNDLRVEKLKELDKKSLLLVNKSAKFSRERSKSRENRVKPVNPFALLVPDIITSNSPPCEARVKPGATVNKEAAAIRIQAVFRGYVQRKLYRRLLVERVQKENDNAKKLEERIMQQNKSSVVPQDEVKVTWAPPLIKEVPRWLKIAPNANNYNFFNAVRRKMHLEPNNDAPVVSKSDEKALKTDDFFVKDERSPHNIARIETGLKRDENRGSSDSDTCKNMSEISLENFDFSKPVYENLPSGHAFDKHGVVDLNRAVLYKERREKLEIRRQEARIKAYRARNLSVERRDTMEQFARGRERRRSEGQLSVLAETSMPAEMFDVTGGSGGPGNLRVPSVGLMTPRSLKDEAELNSFR